MSDSKKNNPVKAIVGLPIDVKDLVEKRTNTKKAAEKVTQAIVAEEEATIEKDRVAKVKDLIKCHATNAENYGKIQADVEPGFNEDLVQLNGGKKTYSNKQGQKKMEAKTKIEL